MARLGSDDPLLIVLVSGATGRTAKEVASAALAQFDQPSVRIVKHANVRSRTAAARIVQEIPDERAVILHSLVSPPVRDTVLEEARRRMIPAVDILGPVLAVLSDQLGREPQGKPGLSYELQKDYLDRIDAVSFTLEHDDGAGMSTLRDAEVVLVGVSRSSKSVTCFYLAYRGVRAANVPLILGVEPPETLLKMPPDRVVGLTISTSRLQRVREARQQRLVGAALDYYVQPDEITRELRYAQQLIQHYGWRTIDVSYTAVEEVAMQVLHLMGRA